jgi:UDP-N-acetylmuramoyl-L-alanyl-D-glutamate--2,6-diaminopimelate ligase
MTTKERVKKFIPEFLLRIYHFKLALLGAFLYGFPGYDKSIKIIGVTGTSGKSTTTDFITKILEENGDKVASVSSIRFKIADKEWENKYKMTMPGRFVIQKFLKQAKDSGCKYIVLEVTSEGIRQFRHKFINFDTVVFTNLSPEHIESHKGFENYRNEKLKLFRVCENIHIVNADDKNAKYFAQIPAISNFQFSIFNKFSSPNFQNVKAEDVEQNQNGISFKVQDINFQISVLGQFNIYNALAAISVAKAYGVNLNICKKALEKAKGIAGRMEIMQKEPFMVVVDYAHTPEQLEAVYKSLTSNIHTLNPKLICVLGSCGGGRDKWKRPVLGEIASRYCKEIIVTNEDPYDENPLSIIREIESALSDDEANRKHQIILDRKEAIKTAIKKANQEDVVIITGKGSEPWMCVANGKKIPWDDRQTARDACPGSDRYSPLSL